MSNIRKSPTNLATMLGVMLIVAIAIWQFYLFATFKDAQGIVDVQGGTSHLWWAIIAASIACVGGFFVFSRFLRYDKRRGRDAADVGAGGPGADRSGRAHRRAAVHRRASGLASVSQN